MVTVGHAEGNAPLECPTGMLQIPQGTPCQLATSIRGLWSKTIQVIEGLGHGVCAATAHMQRRCPEPLPDVRSPCLGHFVSKQVELASVWFYPPTHRTGRLFLWRGSLCRFPVYFWEGSHQPVPRMCLKGRNQAHVPVKSGKRCRGLQSVGPQANTLSS